MSFTDPTSQFVKDIETNMTEFKASLDAALKRRRIKPATAEELTRHFLATIESFQRYGSALMQEATRMINAAPVEVDPSFCPHLTVN